LLELLSNTLVCIVGLFLLLSLTLLILIRDKDTPRWLDISTGLTLIGTSALFLGMLTSLEEMAVSSSTGTQQFKLLISQYKVSILILPFVSAAIGTNVISHALTYNHHYNNPTPLNKEIGKFFYYLCMLIACISFIGILIWGICAYIKKREKA